jgi:hypothetical protein
MVKRICICFNFDDDKNYRFLLSALAKNSRSDIVFEDLTPKEIASSDVGRIKAVIRGKIKAATHTLVVVGKNANSYHPDRARIGTRNWQWWEIDASVEEGKKLIAVKIESSNVPPEPLMGKGAAWAYSFRVESIIAAIDKA